MRNPCENSNPASGASWKGKIRKFSGVSLGRFVNYPHRSELMKKRQAKNFAASQPIRDSRASLDAMLACDFRTKCQRTDGVKDQGSVYKKLDLREGWRLKKFYAFGGF